MSKDPILIVIIIFVILGLSYTPLKNGQNSNSGVSDSWTSSIGESNNPQDVKQSIESLERGVNQLDKEVKEREAEMKRSPYYGKVFLSYISGLNNPDPNYEYFSLTTSLDRNEKVNITGWYLKSEMTGNFARIGQATLLPFPFTKADSDVVIQQNDRVIVSKGSSPIGISFRTNKCTGFFEENRTFNPSLSLMCPRPIDEDLPRFSPVEDRHDQCLDIINSIGRCVTVGTQYIRTLPDSVTISCKEYIRTQINYNNCVTKHFGDTDFPGNEYRLYLNTFGKIWKDSRERINLHDSTGLIVDTLTY